MKETDFIPENSLLKYVKENNIEKITKLIKNDKNLLEHIYPNFLTILYNAIIEKNTNSTTVESLIKLGADLHKPIKLHGEREAIHFAVEKSNSEILRVVVNNLKPNKINELAKGRNALILLIHGKNNNEIEETKCAEILIEAGINVNQGDTLDISPIVWAALYKKLHIIKILIEKCDVDIDSHKYEGKSARGLITENNLYTVELLEKIRDNYENPESMLFKLIKQEDVTRFLTFNEGNIEKFANIDDTSSTLIQYACAKGLTKCVDHLIKNKAYPNKTTDKNNDLPIELAAKYGYHEIVELLVEHLPPNEELIINLTCYVLKFSKDEKFLKCYEILFKRLKSYGCNINQVDQLSNTLLHYAVRFSNSEKILQLLHSDASFAMKNKFNIMPVDDIRADILEKHFDNCIQTQHGYKDIDKKDFRVAIAYKTLVPPNMINNVYNPECNIFESNNIMTEIEVIYRMTKLANLKTLLNHPLIVSILMTKWSRLKWLFWTNLSLYTIYAIFLFIYILFYYGVSSVNNNNTTLVNVSHFIISCSYILLCVREGFQMYVTPAKYFKSISNYVEISQLIITGLILLPKSTFDNTTTSKQLSATVILLSALELVLLVGHHPLCATYVAMLTRVSRNFFKFLMWYCMLIIAFALSFFILFTEHDTETYDFRNIQKTIFKTIVMLSGEFDSSNLKFDDSYPLMSRLIFILFLFIIVIILLNLLTGLAISDTEAIMENAVLVARIAMTQHIRRVEITISKVKLIKTLWFCKPLSFNNASLLNNYKLDLFLNKGSEILDKKSVKLTKAIIRARTNSSVDNNSIEFKIEKLLIGYAVINEKLDTILKKLNENK